MSPVLRKVRFEITEGVVQGVINYYGIEIVGERRGGWLDGLCPTHDDNHPSFSINSETGVNICRSLCGTRSLVKLVAEKEGCSEVAAKAFLEKFADPSTPLANPKMVEKELKGVLKYPMKKLLYTVDSTLSKIIDGVCYYIGQTVELLENKPDARGYDTLYMLDTLLGEIYQVHTYFTFKIESGEETDPIRLQKAVLIEYTKLQKIFRELVMRVVPTIESPERIAYRRIVEELRSRGYYPYSTRFQPRPLWGVDADITIDIAFTQPDLGNMDLYPFVLYKIIDSKELDQTGFFRLKLVLDEDFWSERLKTMWGDIHVPARSTIQGS